MFDVLLLLDAIVAFFKQIYYYFQYEIKFHNLNILTNIFLFIIMLCVYELKTAHFSPKKNGKMLQFIGEFLYQNLQDFLCFLQYFGNNIKLCAL